MAAVSIEAYLALEKALAQRLRDTYSALVEKLLPAIENALKDSDYEKARKMVARISLDEVYTLNEPYIAYLSHVALLFGASRASDSPTDGFVGLGFGKDIVQQSLAAFRHLIAVNAEDALKQQALQLIALRQNPSTPPADTGTYLGTVLKAEKKPSALLPFDSFMDETGRAYFNMVSSLHTSRLSAFGYTAEAQSLGITRYAIDEQLDGRTCPVCNYMHGKTFEVADARSLLDVVVRTQDPEQLKSLQPWPKQTKAALTELQSLTEQELVARGWHVPPFHPRCRGLLVKVGHVPALTGEAPKPPEDYVASAEDFKALGVTLNKNRIDLWNALMKTAPAEVVAQLSQQPVDKLVATALTATDPKKELGIKALSVTDAGVNIELHRPVGVATKEVKQDLYFRKDKSLFVGSVELDPADAKASASILKSLYGAARLTGMERMVMTAGADISGYAYARYGFTMDAGQWAALKKQVGKNLAATNIADMMSELDNKVLNAILASDDPKMVFALADIPNLGKALLSGTQWVGYLQLDDPEAMKRFLSFFGENQ